MCQNATTESLKLYSHCKSCLPATHLSVEPLCFIDTSLTRSTSLSPNSTLSLMFKTGLTPSTATNSQVVPPCCDCPPRLYLRTHSQPCSQLTHSHRPTDHCQIHPSSIPAAHFQSKIERRGGHTTGRCNRLPQKLASIVVM